MPDYKCAGFSCPILKPSYDDNWEEMSILLGGAFPKGDRFDKHSDPVLVASYTPSDDHGDGRTWQTSTPFLGRHLFERTLGRDRFQNLQGHPDTLQITTRVNSGDPIQIIDLDAVRYSVDFVLIEQQHIVWSRVNRPNGPHRTVPLPIEVLVFDEKHLAAHVPEFEDMAFMHLGSFVDAYFTKHISNLEIKIRNTAHCDSALV